MIPPNSVHKYMPCCICKSNKIRCHRLPALSTDEEKLLRYAKWVTFGAIENVYKKLKYYWICEKHFEDNAFCNHLKLNILRTAVPTLNPPIYQGPSTEDGSPPGPTETKDETIKKIIKEVIERQSKSNSGEKRRKCYNFITAPSNKTATDLKEKENHSGNNIKKNPYTTAILKQDSKSALVRVVKDNLCFPLNKSVVSSQNGSLKLSVKTNHNPKQSGYIRKIISGSSGLSLIQRTKPLILKKLPASFKTCSSDIQLNPSQESGLLNTASNADLSAQLLSDKDICPSNLKSASHTKIVKNISAINNEKLRAVDVATKLDFQKKNVVKNVSTTDLQFTKDLNLISADQNIFKIDDSLHEVVISTSNEKDKQLDDSLTEIKQSEVLLSENTSLDGKIVSGDKENDNKQSPSSKYIKKQPVSKKKYYDPVLIDSVLNKMKLKKNGPVCVVTLEKKPDKIFKGFSKSKLVTLYKQQTKKNRKNNKINQGVNKSNNDVTKKVRKKRRCTCSIHCHRRLNNSKISSPVTRVNAGVGIKFEGTKVNPNLMNVNPHLADEELFNVENVFNLSTILTNVHDRSQIEQLCQMLIESIFRLKSLNIEGTMAKLQVYIAQLPENRVNGPASDDPSTTYKEVNETVKPNSSSQNVQISVDEESNDMNAQEVILSNSQENECNKISSYIRLTNEEEINSFGEVPVTAEVSYQSVSNDNVKSFLPKPKNVKVRLSAFHDHSYVKQESNYIFEKPEYLVKLINIETYRCPRKSANLPQSGTSKKEIERHNKVCLKLNNRIKHLRELIQKKNKNIISMHRKIKYLGGIVCQEKGIKRIKYPKVDETLQEKHPDSSKIRSEEQLRVKKTDEPKMLLDVDEDHLRIENVVTLNSFDSSFFQDNTHIKAKKTQGTKTKKNTSVESFDVLYENLIEELCCNEMQY